MRLCDHYVAESLEPRRLLSFDSELTPSAFAGMPAVFVPNEGQWDSAIRYAAHGTGADILFTDTGPTFRIVDRPDAPRDRFGPDELDRQGLDDIHTITRPVTVNEWSLSFLDAARVAPAGIDRQQTVFNYYLGDPSTWRSGVSSFGGVVYRDLWSGIDAHVMARDGGMKYEFHLDPGADPQSIALRYEDVEGLSLGEAGGLWIRTPAGTITDDAPIAWQTRRDGMRVEVAAKFVLLDAFTYTISPTGAYDPSLPLVLDPQLAFGSFLGGNARDSGDGIASDGAGGAWVTGYTQSSNFPTPGGFDTTRDADDVFVARVSADGTLAFASFLGGTSNDFGADIVADGAGGAWVMGTTTSTDFPTPDGFDTTYNGGRDTFVAHITAGGTLGFGSYLGGGGNAIDEGYAIAPDGAGGVWLTGYTRSSTFPTPGGFDTTLDGFSDAYVARVTAGGTLAFASYLGGSGHDTGFGIAPDGAGGAWVTGRTESIDFPTPGGFQTTGFAREAFVVHVTANGTLAFASYLGGGNDDEARAIATDGAGGAWVTGFTLSADFPTPGGFDTTHGGGGDDGFVAHVTAGGTLAFASFLGGTAIDLGAGIAPDGAGGAWVTGQAWSADFPTPGGFDTTNNGGGDAFVARVTPDGTLAFASFLGGGAEDVGRAIAADGTGGAWVTGSTSSTDFPTPGGFDTTYNGGDNDAFIARISDPDTTPPTVTASQFVFESAPQSIRITFSEDVSASLNLDDLTLQNLTTGQTIPSGNLALSYGTASNTATITFPGYPYGALPDGTYRATLLASGVTDAAGNPLPSNHVLDFFFKQGDANRDEVVNLADFNILAANFGQEPRDFAHGDFNYDGRVNLADFNILAAQFGTSLGADGSTLRDSSARWPALGGIQFGQRAIQVGSARSAGFSPDAEDELIIE